MNDVALSSLSAPRPASITGLSLCSGGGGLELGLRLALGDAYRAIAYCEREAYAAALLCARMADATLDEAPVWDDLTTFPGQQFAGRVSVLSAGFPCQPHSTAGQRRGTADERWLWPDIGRLIGAVGPAYVFLENVRPLLHSGLGDVLATLAGFGFAAEWDCFSAAEVGASHRRERLFVLAHRGVGRCGGEPWRRPAQFAANGRTAVVAHGDESGCGPRKRDLRPGQSDVAGCGGGVANAASERRTAAVDAQPAREWGRFALGGPIVGDAASGRDERSDLGAGLLLRPHQAGGVVAHADRRASGRRHGPRASGSAGSDGEPEGSGEWLEHAQSAGREDGREGLPGDAGRRTVGDAARSGTPAAQQPGRLCSSQPPDVPLFPPGPGDLAGWRHVLAQRPDLAPALEPGLRGVADGLAGRVDRLRTAGNGVVPLVAAYAFLVLLERLGDG